MAGPVCMTHASRLRNCKPRAKGIDRAVRRGMCWCLSLLLLFLLCGTATAQSLKTVRVGYFAFDGYHSIDDKGERSGYGYEFLQHLVGYTDWEYAYVGYDQSWSEMQNMLERGEIDLLTSAQKTEARMERFDFSEEPIGISATILTAKAGNERYAARDDANWNGMRVGMLRDNSRNDSFAAYAEARGFRYVPVYFDETEAMVAALKSDDGIDAIVTSNLRSIDGEWVLAQFDPSPFYIMVRKGNTALLQEINDALEQLFVDEPDLCTQLMDRYYTPDNGGEIPFTLEERAFLADMRNTTFTAAVNPDRAPFSFMQNGRLSGIIVDIAQRIVDRSGLRVEFADVKDSAQYRALVESGGVDIRFDACYQYAPAEALGYRITVPYLDVSISKLYKRGSHGTSAVAMLRDADRSYESGVALSVDQPIVYYDSIDAMAEAVRSGRQDAAYLYTRCAEWAIQNNITNQLASENIYGYENAFAVAVNAKQDHRLFSILNKTVDSISQKEIGNIDRIYTTYKEKPFSLIGYLYNNPMAMAGGVAGIFLVAALILLLLYQSRRRRKTAEQLNDEKRRAGLLADALAAAERADAAKSQFLSRVSHEMRTPLNAIIGFMTLAQDADALQVKQYLSNSEAAAKQLLCVINDVLDMSAIESGKMKIAQAPFDFKQMIQAVTNIYASQCGQKGLAYETRFQTSVDEWLIGDHARVNQILLNLLGNAIKFTAAGHVFLTISQHDAPEDRVFVRFEVSDTGCGMSEDMQTRLFQAFEQESAATFQQFGGSGLGLSIVKNLVNMMDGAIRVDSQLHEGTTITVDLPFHRGANMRGTKTVASGAALHVLVVDDVDAELEYMARMLERMSVRHAGVHSGKEAFDTLNSAACKGEPYNVCFIDWKLPGMDGIEITRCIREKYGNDMVVVVTSAYEYCQAKEEAMAAGADLVVSKPLFQSALFDLFMTLTGGRMVRPETAMHEADFAGRRILLVEDNAMNRIVASGLVKKFGVTCEEATDGRMAVDMFSASAPGYYDAILMDIQMPVMDGFEATEAIRACAHPDAKTVQIIALTANAFNEDIAKTLSSGMNAHVAKPIEVSALHDALGKAFAAKQAAQDGETR